MGWGSQAGPSSDHMASQADANYSSSVPWKGQAASQRRSLQARPDTQASQGPDPLGNPPGGQSKVYHVVAVFLVVPVFEPLHAVFV